MVASISGAPCPFSQNHLAGVPLDTEVEALAAHRTKLDAHQPLNDYSRFLIPFLSLRFRHRRSKSEGQNLTPLYGVQRRMCENARRRVSRNVVLRLKAPMFLPTVPMNYRVQRITLPWFEFRPFRIGKRDQARLRDLGIGNAEQLRHLLLLKEQM
jgi:hypothetical protein